MIAIQPKKKFMGTVVGGGPGSNLNGAYLGLYKYTLKAPTV
jgi:hypothetical protein